MSGFAGIVNLDGAPVNPSLLERMTCAMAFRGPDAQGVWCCGTAGLGHAMLRATRESEREQQPLQHGNRFSIVADARVDARADLIAALNPNLPADRKVSLATPDVELILAAYERWGEACLDHLIGDFSFAIWDVREMRLFCARDHFGVKPFYYARIGNALVFSNTLEVLRLYPGITTELSDAAIGDFLLIGLNLHPARSPFEQIPQLPPAHAMTVSDDQVRVARYWTLPVEEPLRYRRSRDYVEEFQQLLDMAVEDRLRADRASISLSGGLDSPTVAAIAAPKLAASDKLLGLTFGYDRAVPDPEPRYARTVAQYLGIPHRYFAFDSYEPFEQLDSSEACWPWPQELNGAPASRDLHQAAARHGRVMLTGQGGDPGIAPSLQVHGGIRVFPLAWNTGKFMLTRGHHPRIGFRVSWQRWRGKPVRQLPRYPEWLDPEFESRMGLRDRFHRIVSDSPSVHPFRPDSYNSLAGDHWPFIFEHYDAGRTRMPLDVRHPLFDLRLQRFFLRLPILPWCADKELLRVAMRGRLPGDILRRPKTPVKGEPLSEVLREADPTRLNNFVPAPGFERFVVRERIPILGGEARVADPGLHLHPIELNYWLHSLSGFAYKP